MVFARMYYLNWIKMTYSKQRPQQMQLALLATLLCVGYWLGFSSLNTNEHDPIKNASFYMEIGN